MRTLLLLASLAIACGGEQNKSEPSSSAQPTPGSEQPAMPVQPAQGAIDGGAANPEAAAPTDTCVTDCVASRQMQATSPEQIEADCRARCAGDAPALESE